MVLALLVTFLVGFAARDLLLRWALDRRAARIADGEIVPCLACGAILRKAADQLHGRSRPSRIADAGDPCPACRRIGGWEMD